jgi:hypothetical protein
MLKCNDPLLTRAFDDPELLAELVLFSSVSSMKPDKLSNWLEEGATIMETFRLV